MGKKISIKWNLGIWENENWEGGGEISKAVERKRLFCIEEIRTMKTIISQTIIFCPSHVWS